MPNIKQQLLEKCIQWAEARITIGQESLDQLNVSLEMETKSSMGDKYETSREMIQMEKNKLMNQIDQASQIRNALKQINPLQQNNKVETGSLVYTSNGNFYISAGIGTLLLDEPKPREYFAISLLSPMGQALKDGKTGESRQFQNKQIRIFEIE
jgi:LPS O-antigen subunit length determinant protein (WzzB/FepE family)